MPLRAAATSMTTAPVRTISGPMRLRRPAATTSAVRSDEPVLKFLADSQSFFFSRNYLALLEIIVIARHRPMLARTNTPVVRKFREHLNAIWIDALCEAGYERKSAETF